MSFEDGQQIDLGGRLIDIHHTPGHSPGGITVYDSQSRLLFPADAVNYGPLYLFSDQADLAGVSTNARSAGDTG